MPVGIRMLEDCGTGTSSPKGKMPARCRFVDAGTINGSAGRARWARMSFSAVWTPPRHCDKGLTPVTATKLW